MVKHPIISIIEMLRYHPQMFSICLLAGANVCLLLYIRPKFQWAVAPRILFLRYGWGLIGAMLGGKILSFLSMRAYALENRWNLWESIMNLGFVYYGAIIGMLVSIMIHSHFQLARSLTVTDTLFRLIPIGQFFGRIGCFFNGCCYGREYSGFGAVRCHMNGQDTTVIPTWFIEGSCCLILGMILLFHKGKSKGFYTFTYFISYGMIRFLIEFLRGDVVRGHIGIFSTSQWISLIFMMLGIAGMIFYKGERDSEEQYSEDLQ